MAAVPRQKHVRTRGGDETTTKLLRNHHGRPIGRRRFDYLSERLRAHLPWAAALQFSIHWLRHTPLTWVEREYGYAVARAYADHAQTASNAGATLTYVRAGMPEVAYALSALTGETHPMAATDLHPLTARPTDSERAVDDNV